MTSVLYYVDSMPEPFSWVQHTDKERLRLEKYAKIAERRYRGTAEIRSLERYYKPPGSVALRGE